MALGSAWEAGAGLIWVDFNFVVSLQAPIQWSLNSWAAQANHCHPTDHLTIYIIRMTLSLTPFGVQVCLQKPCLCPNFNIIAWNPLAFGSVFKVSWSQAFENQYLMLCYLIWPKIAQL